MDNFKELAAMARYTDVLVQVTKYHLGPDLQVNVAIMTSSATVTTGLVMKYSQTKPCKLIQDMPSLRSGICVDLLKGNQLSSKINVEQMIA
jgi:hypothetical protein